MRIELKIESLSRVGPFKFGMGRDEVRKLSLGEVRSFYRSSESLFPSDQFLGLGVIVSYEEPGVVDAIEFSRLSCPVYLNVNLFDLSVSQLKNFLAERDPNLEIESDGFISHNLGIGAYVIAADEDDDVDELVSIIAFKKGYYD